ncbi:serine/threonine protein kinase [bacterium]|nr:serine/threonine protein kinase [bacterium]
MGRLVALVALLVGLAYGQDPTAVLTRRLHTIPLHFSVHPPQAQLLLQNQLQDPMAPGTYLLQAASLGVQDPDEPIPFHFHLAGYRDQKIELSWNQIQGGGYPGEIRLRPASPAAIYREYRRPVELLALSSVVLIGGALIRAYRSRGLQRRHQKLDALIQSEPFDALIGSRIDRYRVVQALGRGGMASVYRAVPEDSLDMAQQVAIKCIRPEQLTASFKERFAREVSVLCTLDHPNIVRVLDWGEQAGLPFLVMEVVEGETLARLIPKGGMGRSDFLRVFSSLRRALAHAHELGIAHRDLKPANVMVNRNHRVKLMDFGLAQGHRFASLTVPGQALGTPAYMPPEMLVATSYEPALSDQYSLAVMAFEMLCGRRPFEHQEVTSLLMLRLSQAAPGLRQFRPELPPSAACVLARMLDREPLQRYPSVEEGGRALEDSLGGSDFGPRLQPLMVADSDDTQAVQVF